MAFRAAALLTVVAVMPVLAPGLTGAVSLTAGAPAPDFTVRMLDGSEVSFHDYRGRAVLIVFWSSWRSRCREEIAFLRTMKEKHHALEILALNVETERPAVDDVARINEAVRSWEMPLAVAIDDGLRVWHRYQVNAPPTSLIVGADGTLFFIEPIFSWASPEKIDGNLGSAFAVRGTTAAPGAGEAVLPAEGDQTQSSSMSTAETV